MRITAICLWRYAENSGRHCKAIETKCIPVNHESNGRGAFALPYFLKGFLNQQNFSTSVHGDEPSAEYAKSRRATLESEFGHALGSHGSKAFSVYHRFGPFLAFYRATIILSKVAVLSFWHLFVKDIHKRAAKLRRILIQLGPFYIKLGQALSTRPDILPNAYCQELAKLQDQIPPFSTRLAIQSIQTQLGAPISKLFADISSEPVAAASLGQVYKAHLHTGELVAVKVQRPGMPLMLALDAHLIHMIGGQLKHYAKARGDLLSAVNEMVRHMFEEIDYIHEAQNAERFASLYGFDADYKSSLKYQGVGGSSDKRSKGTSNYGSQGKSKSWVKVPKIYWDFTRKSVLTMEWIDGIKLTDKEGIEEAHLNIKQLVDQGVYCSLRQLLEEGYFHADPHPGNLVAIRSGSLAYLDFGMMGNIPRQYRVGLIRTLVHFVNRDSMGLANDFFSLGFLPEGTDMQTISDAMQASFGDEATKSQLDFQGIMNQLADVMYEYNFSLPPDYALVIRALGSLEGTAKSLDPDFKVVASAYPYIVGRLLADPDPDMRKILRELLIKNNGSIRWHRLERLVMAIAEQTSDTEKDVESSKAQDDVESSEVREYALSFDMRAVAASTVDLVDFIFSGKGERVRVFLIQDIVNAVDTFLQQEILSYLYLERNEPVGDSNVSYQKHRSNSEYILQNDSDDRKNAFQDHSVKFEGNPKSKFASRGDNGQHYRDNHNRGNKSSESSEKSSATREDTDTDDEQKRFFLIRVIAGLRAFAKAVNSAPESCQRVPETIWLQISRAIHKFFERSS
ncbi:hypothetical protein SUGI_0540290 [Cryptomeria japonica]|nr:hypothetical protein SUGI_0540290 [Cryptomeria japonica]